MKALRTLFVTVLFVMVATSLSFGSSISIVEYAQAPAGQTFFEALTYISQGLLQADTLILETSRGQYGIDVYEFLIPLVIKAAPGLAEKPQLRPATRSSKGNEVFKLRNDLTLEGLVLDGTVMNSTEMDSIKRVFKVYLTEEGPNQNPDFTLKNCDFRNIYLNGNMDDVDGKFVEFDKATTCGDVYIENCTFTNFGDEIFNASNAYKSDHVVSAAHGGHFASFTCRNTTFNNVDGSCIKLNGDADSTTVDGKVLLENLTFNFCQRRVIWCRDLMGQVVRNIIIANSKKGHETFSGTDELIRVEMVGSTISHVDTFNIQGVKSDGDTVVIAKQPFIADGGSKNGAREKATFDRTTVYNYDPMFADAANGDFTLMVGSELYHLGHDNGALGDRNWAMNPYVGTTIEIAEDAQAPTGQTLFDAMTYINEGLLAADTLVLTTSGGQYGFANYEFLVPMVLKAKEGLAEKPQLRPRERAYKGNECFKLRNDLKLEGLVIDGMVMNSTEIDSIKRLFKVYLTEEGPNKEPDFIVKNCDVRNIYLNGDPEDTDGKFIEFDKAASCGRVYIENCTFTNLGDEAFNASNAYKSDHVVSVPHGGHFAMFTIKNSTFNNVDGSCIKLNGDADSTTVDGIVTLENITFNNCQRRVIWCRDLMNQVVRNIIIANSKKGHETFSGTDELIRVEMEGSYIAHVDTFNIEGVKADGDTVVVSDSPFVADGGSNNGARRTAMLYEDTIYGLDPMFADAANGDFTLMSGSPLYTLAEDGGALGDRNWATEMPTLVQEKPYELPDRFSLSQNYPNPFNPSTKISFTLDQPSLVKLTVFNILGRRVDTIVNTRMSAGVHTINWEATQFASGMYFYRLESNGKVLTKKMMLMK